MNSQRILQLLAERVGEMFVLFCVLIGAIGGAATSAKIQAMRLGARLTPQIIGFLLVTLAMGWFMGRYVWNGWVLCIVALPAGLFSARIGLTVLSLWTDDDDFFSFLGKFRRLIAAVVRFGMAFKKAYDEQDPTVNHDQKTE